MEKKKEPSLVNDLGYWEVREEIKAASLRGDEETLNLLAMTYPEAFTNALNQAKNKKRAKR